MRQRVRESTGQRIPSVRVCVHIPQLKRVWKGKDVEGFFFKMSRKPDFEESFAYVLRLEILSLIQSLHRGANPSCVSYFSPIFRTEVVTSGCKVQGCHDNLLVIDDRLLQSLNRATLPQLQGFLSLSFLSTYTVFQQTICTCLFASSFQRLDSFIYGLSNTKESWLPCCKGVGQNGCCLRILIYIQNIPIYPLNNYHHFETAVRQQRIMHRCMCCYSEGIITFSVHC